MSSDARQATTPGTSPTGQWQVILLLAVAAIALLRVGLAFHKSLVLDEFHSWFHATRPNFGAFLESLRADNHPPLSFLIVGAARSALGSSEWALRTPALVFGLIEIALVARLARSLSPDSTNGGRMALLAAVTLGCSAMHADYGTQARMYALHALSLTACTAAVLGLVSRAQPSRGTSALLAAGAWTSFHTHYFGVQYLAALTVAGVLAAALSGEAKRARRLLLPLGAAGAGSLPWALTGFREQLGHDLPPGGDDLGLQGLLESFAHLFAHNVHFAGNTLRWLFLAGAFVGLVLAGVGALRLLRTPEGRAAGIILGTMAFGVPVASWALATALPRAGYTWHYILPSAAAASVLLAVGARTGPPARLAWIPGGLGLALLGLQLLNPATEDFRGATRFLLAEAAATPAGKTLRIVSVEWQPALFPQGQPYDYYAPRLSESPPKREAMFEGSFTVQDRRRVEEADRVLVLRRSLPPDQPLRARLRSVFGDPSITSFGYGVDVLDYQR